MRVKGGIFGVGLQCCNIATLCSRAEMDGSYKRWGFQLSLTGSILLCLIRPWSVEVGEGGVCLHLLVSAQLMHNMRQRLHETATIKRRREKKREKYPSLTNLVRCFFFKSRVEWPREEFFSRALHQTLLVNARRDHYIDLVGR